MINNRKWVALFSHTGSEIVNISNMIGRSPDKLVTNNNNVHKMHRNVRHCTYTKKIPDVVDYELLLGNQSPVVTLHGWMRVIPPEICSKYEIYNLHPGLITDYPELKGKDPQKRAWKNRDKYPTIGCVIHKVIPQVDEGEPILVKSIPNTCETESELFEKLHSMASSMWVELFKDDIMKEEIRK